MRSNSLIVSVCLFSPWSSLPSLNQVILGSGSPSASHVRLTDDSNSGKDSRFGSAIMTTSSKFFLSEDYDYEKLKYSIATYDHQSVCKPLTFSAINSFPSHGITSTEITRCLIGTNTSISTGHWLAVIDTFCKEHNR